MIRKIILLTLLLIFISGCCITGSCIEETSDTEQFAKFLTSEGIAMAGLETCPHCREQKSKFGDAFEYVDYYDCAIKQDWCSEHNIERVPAWVFPNGEVYVGVKTLAELKELSKYYDKI